MHHSIRSTTGPFLEVLQTIRRLLIRPGRLRLEREFAEIMPSLMGEQFLVDPRLKCLHMCCSTGLSM